MIRVADRLRLSWAEAERRPYAEALVAYYRALRLDLADLDARRRATAAR